MFEPKLFYKAYQINYFDYKQLNLIKLLNKYEQKNPKHCKTVIGYSKSDFLRSIKMDIRQTYFQAIETVFAFIFALKPDEKGFVDELNLMFRISERTSHYEEIRNFAEGKNGLEFLDQKIPLTNGEETTFTKYLFYFGLDTKKFTQIPDSLNAIRNGLKIIAKDISDRREYNSYKHGLRTIPALTKFILAKKDDLKIIGDWDLTDSISFYEKNKKTEEIRYFTKIFDTLRDFKMSIFCSNLLYCIIQPRKSFFFNEKEKFKVLFFNKKNISEYNKVSVSLQNLTLTIKNKNEV